MNPSAMRREEREEREEPSKIRASSGSRSDKDRELNGKKVRAVTAEEPSGVCPVERAEPNVNRPGYATHDEFFVMHGRWFRPGLYWHDSRDDEPVDIWIATPIHALASTRDEHGGSWGLLLRFLNSDGHWREWAAPMRLLAGSGEELRSELLHYGLRFDLQQRGRLLNWIMNQQPKARLTAATRTGWYANGRAFVLPGQTIGDKTVRFQSEAVHAGCFGAAGTLTDWQKQVAEPCRENPLLILAVSAAFAGPLILRAKQHEQGGAGIHYIGDSSQGKSTALQVGASVWAAPRFVATWRATTNGLEGAAAGRNDTILILDELSECPPREAGAIVYLLGNGTGKQRAARTGIAREPVRWRLMCLSSGERTLAAHMAEGGRAPNAGQEARLLDIPATTRAHGLFDELHGRQDGRAFADDLKRATADHFGHAGPAFVKRLIVDTQGLPGFYAEIRNVPEFQTRDGLESRAAGWFGLIAMAGELATKYGITRWTRGEALAAAVEGFNLWRDCRGEGQTENRRILDGVASFLQAYGDSRFTALNEEQPPKAASRAGWFRDTEMGRIYLFNRSALLEAGKGFDLRRIVTALVDAEWIVDHDSGRRTKKTHIPARNESLSLYAVRPQGE